MACITDLQQQFFSALFNGLAIGAIYALIALGLNMVYGVLGLINFAHGDVMMVGTFAAVGVVIMLGGGPSTAVPMVVVLLLVAALAAVLASGIAAMVLELVAYRPLRVRGAPRHAGMISGLGASIVLSEGFAILFGRNVVPFPEVMQTKTVLTVGDGIVTNKMLLVFMATIGMLILLDYFVTRTRLGRGIRAVAQEPRAAVLMGVNISRVVLVTFLVGGLCAGLAGFLYSLTFSKTLYSIGFLPGIKALAAAILGGVGNMRGAVLGGFTLGLMENFGTVCLPVELKDVIAFSALVLVLLFRPAGILGRP